MAMEIYRLCTAKGSLVGAADLPVMVPKPGIIVYGQRYFVPYAENEYREATVAWAAVKRKAGNV